MKKATIIALSIILLMSTIWSCTRKIYEPVYVPVPSSTSTTINNRLAPASLPIPDNHQVNLSVDSSSFLEDAYYSSEAKIMPDGRLHHTLDAKPGAVLTGTVAVSDTTIHDTINTPYPVPGPIKYINELTTWQKICYYGFNFLIGSLVGSILIWLLKRKFMP